MVIDYVFLGTDTKFSAKDRYRPDVLNKTKMHRLLDRSNQLN